MGFGLGARFWNENRPDHWLDLARRFVEPRKPMLDDAVGRFQGGGDVALSREPNAEVGGETECSAWHGKDPGREQRVAQRSGIGSPREPWEGRHASRRHNPVEEAGPSLHERRKEL